MFRPVALCAPNEDRGAGGGRGGSEEGGGGWLGPPPSSEGPPMVPARGGPSILKRKNPLGTEGAEAKVWLSASNIGRGGGGGSRGVPPPSPPFPPAVYGRSNTSLPPPPTRSKLEQKVSDVCIEEINLRPSEPFVTTHPPPEFGGAPRATPGPSKIVTSQGLGRGTHAPTYASFAHCHLKSLVRTSCPRRGIVGDRGLALERPHEDTRRAFGRSRTGTL